jgi:ATP-dependent DNA helicase PIF1
MRESTVKPESIEINEQFQHALDMMECTSKHIFITGRAGTGKSTLLEYFRNNTKRKIVVLAPTGVAALNVKGQTIHSFFRFKPDITVEKIKQLRRKDKTNSIYKQLDAIVIDEISMVRADLLDCVDTFLRLYGLDKKAPFGGIQMIFVGDLYQLPPVVSRDDKTVFSSVYETPYFFSARAFEHLDMEFIELEKVYRQHDDDFISLLNAIRNNTITDKHLELLNQRCLPDYEPEPDDFYVYLTTTNALADSINGKQLDKLMGAMYTFNGRIDGEFGKEYLPTAIDLKMKVGAQIMMLTNDASGRWVNGTVGKVMAINIEGDSAPVILAELANGEEIIITPWVWHISRFFIDEGRLQSEVVGTFTQYPLMLAWAVTIHKSQGKTFDKVIIDIGRGTFAHGQMYVALSRCTRLDGIVLKKPISKNNIWADYKIVKFLTKYQYQKSEEACSLDTKMALIEKAIATNSALQIVYLKPNDEKSKRIIEPAFVGEMEFNGVKYLGVEAFCRTRNKERVFRVDRILEIEEL